MSYNAENQSPTTPPSSPPRHRSPQSPPLTALNSIHQLQTPPASPPSMWSPTDRHSAEPQSVPTIRLPATPGPSIARAPLQDLFAPDLSMASTPSTPIRRRQLDTSTSLDLVTSSGLTISPSLRAQLRKRLGLPVNRKIKRPSASPARAISPALRGYYRYCARSTFERHIERYSTSDPSSSTRPWVPFVADDSEVQEAFEDVDVENFGLWDSGMDISVDTV